MIFLESWESNSVPLILSTQYVERVKVDKGGDDGKIWKNGKRVQGFVIYHQSPRWSPVLGPGSTC